MSGEVRRAEREETGASGANVRNELRESGASAPRHIRIFFAKRRSYRMNSFSSHFEEAITISAFFLGLRALEIAKRMLIDPPSICHETVILRLPPFVSEVLAN